MPTVSTDIDDIRRRMGEIRRVLHEDVRDVVASAEAVTDWHRYIKMYPWVALGAAFAVGYLVVPRRHRKVPTNLATQADVAQVREAVASAQETAAEVAPAPKAGRGLLRGLWSLLGPIATRTAQGYAMQYLENWILQQQQAAAGTPFESVAPRPTSPGPRPQAGPGRARGPGAH